MSSTFESLRVWHDARRLSVAIYAAARAGQFARDFGLRDQICRAAISIMSNIAEGFERGSGREFLQFLKVAKGSAGEVRSQLYAAEDLGYLEPEAAQALRKQAASIARQIAWLAQDVRQKGDRVK